MLKDLFSNLPIKWKVLSIILTLTTLSLTLTVLGLAYNARMILQQASLSNLTVLADVIGNNNQAALRFEDAQSATEALSALSANTHILTACIYDAGGQVFARYTRHDRTDDAACPATPPVADQATYDANTFTLFRSTRLQDTRIGTIYLASDTLGVTQYVRNLVLVSLLLFLGILAFIFLASFRLQGWITRPIGHLIGTMKAVSQEKNYTIRAQKDGEDELGVLVDGFNEMLAEVQASHQALQASEARNRMILDTALDAVVTMDGHGQIASWNPQAEAIFGWPAEEAIARDLADVIIPPAYRAAHREGLQRFKDSGAGPVLNRRIEIEALHRDGHTFPVELAIAPVEIDGHYLFGAFVRDITERKQAQQDLQHYADELERSNKELDDFAYIASHDLKEPLRGIHNFAKLLLAAHTDQLDQRGQDKLETLSRLAQRMETLIDSLLYYSRVGRTELAIAETDLNTVVHDVLESLQFSIEEHNVAVRIVEPLPTVRCDRIRIAEVYRNLITNALKYNDKPDRWIEIGHRRQDDADHPVFYVRDNGIGIRKKHLDTIFHIFKRLHSRDKYGGGTGIGMTIIKKIIERHEGRIWAESTFGEGSTFYFTLTPDAA